MKKYKGIHPTKREEKNPIIQSAKVDILSNPSTIKCIVDNKECNINKNRRYNNSNEKEVECTAAHTKLTSTYFSYPPKFISFPLKHSGHT